MTSIYFVRHAQPDEKYLDDRTRPLTATGMADSQEVARLFHSLPIHRFLCSPYRRSIDTIAPWAQAAQKEITTDERLRERRQGIGTSTPGFLEKRWNDFEFCEEGGETLGSVQRRNMEALQDILHTFPNQSIVVGTRGTALSTVMNYYDSSLGCGWFRKIWHVMPYVIRMDFEDQQLIRTEELFGIERGY